MDGTEQVEAETHGSGRWAPWLLALIPLALFLTAGFRGLEFGEHWDQKLRSLNVMHALERQTLLPRDYNYPSVTFALTVLTAAPEIVDAADLDPATKEFEGEVERFVRSDAFQMRGRAVFLCLASLTLLWVFGTVLAIRRRPWEALVAALLVAGSFEIVYRSRWIAPDAVLMQFGALTLFACTRAMLSPRRGGDWLMLAAVAAGFAVGTKYTGGILILPIAFVAWQRPARLRALAGSLVLFGATFLLTTPGAMLEPTRFLAHVQYEVGHYREGHAGYTVNAGLEHLGKMLRYLLVEAPSPWTAVSVAFFALGVLGVVAYARRAPRIALVLLIVPVSYVLYFSNQRVMFVRNLLLVMPVAAVFTAVGLGVLWDRIASRPGRVALATAAGLALVANLVYQQYAAQTIRDRSPERLATGVVHHLADRPDTVFQVSPRVQELLAEHDVALGDNARLEPGPEVEFVVLFPGELRNKYYWPCNVPGLMTTIGPRVVNYAYNSTWRGDFIAVLRRDDLRALAQQHLLPYAVEAFFPELEGELPERAGRDANGTPERR